MPNQVKRRLLISVVELTGRVSGPLNKNSNPNVLCKNVLPVGINRRAVLECTPLLDYDFAIYACFEPSWYCLNAFSYLFADLGPKLKF